MPHDDFLTSKIFARLVLIASSVTFACLASNSVLAQAPQPAKKSVGRKPASVEPPAKSVKQQTFQAEELFKRYKPAVVKIVVKQQNIPVSVGTGFFVGKTGQLVTNYHVIRSAIANIGFSTDFILANGTVIREFNVGNCGDARSLDLCTLKLNVKSPSYFPLGAGAPSPGETIYVIGHPRGLDFSISNGIVSAVRKSPEGIGEVQISAAISPGNSGGPIFDSRGNLVGMASKYLKDGQNLNFGILSSELTTYVAHNGHFTSPSSANQRMAARTRKTMRDLADTLMTPAVAAAAKGKPVATLKGFHEVVADFGDENMHIALPDQVGPCTRQTVDGAPGEAPNPVVVCFGMNDSIAFSIQRLALPEPGFLLTRNGKILEAPKPISIVGGLIEQGLWSEYEKSLTPSQHETFFSKPGIASCQRLRANPTPKAYFDKAPTCRFNVQGDTEPEAYSANVWVERGKFLYGVTLWMDDASLNDFFSLVPSIAVLSAQYYVGPATSPEPVNKKTSLPLRQMASVESQAMGPASYYSLSIPSDMEFTSARRRANGTQYDTYATKHFIGNPGDETLIVVDRVNSVFPANEFDKISRELIDGVAKSLKIQIKKETLEVESAALDGLPGRIVTGLGVTPAARRRCKREFNSFVIRLRAK